MIGSWIVIVFLVCVTCHGKSVSRCGSDEFSCRDGSCVSKMKWCDGREECEDGTDEDYCHTKSGLDKNPNRCDETFFQCNDGRCIPITGRCDGYQSCEDRSDEEGCSTTANETEPSSYLLTTPMELKLAEALFSTFDPTHSATFNESTESLPEVETILGIDTETLKNESYEATISNQANVNFINIITSPKNSEIYNVTSTVFSKEDNFITSSSVIVDASDTLNKYATTSARALQFEEAVNGVKQNTIPRDFEYNGINRESGDILYENFTRNPLVINDMEYTASHDVSETVSAILNMSVKSKTSGNADTYDQADAKTLPNISNEIKDLEREFIELKPNDRNRARALQWLLKSRNADYGWGEETPRAIIAAYMADDSTKKQIKNEMLMSRQLHLELLAKLIRNDTKPISLAELSLYINALVASCDNPKNFYGQDLINTLRQRTNVAHETSKAVAPLVYITLCINNATTLMDVRKIEELTAKFNKADIGALASLAATCISRMQEFSRSRIGQIAGKKLLRKIMDEGLPENIYELALVSQALNEARINQGLWNREAAMSLIASSQQSNGSFGDIMSTYYTVPILSGRSLLFLGQQCIGDDKGLVSETIKDSEDEKVDVSYSLYLGDPVEVSQILTMRVPKFLNFLDGMRIAETINPAYRFKYDMSKGKPIVYSIGGIVNDAELGLYWTLYLSHRNSTQEGLVPYEGDIRSLVPGLGENLVFWMKSIF